MFLEVDDLESSLAAAEERLQHFLTSSGVAARPAYRANLVFEELATNALKYGGNGTPPPRLRCAVRLEPGDLVLEFVDRGRPFDPSAARAAPRPTSLADATLGGLGLVLVSKVARAVDYRRVDGENRTTVRLSLGPD